MGSRKMSQKEVDSWPESHHCRRGNTNGNPFNQVWKTSALKKMTESKSISYLQIKATNKYMCDFYFLLPLLQFVLPGWQRLKLLTRIHANGHFCSQLAGVKIGTTFLESNLAICSRNFNDYTILPSSLFKSLS